MPSLGGLMAMSSALAERIAHRRYFCPNPKCPLRHGFSGREADVKSYAEKLDHYTVIRVEVFCPVCGSLVDRDVEVVT